MIHLQYTLLLLIHWLFYQAKYKYFHLQYTLLLLIQSNCSFILPPSKYLQYTLLLLIHIYTSFIHLLTPLFTIHFATINTQIFLQSFFGHFLFTIHFATINTSTNSGIMIGISAFTIHFATINTLRIGIKSFFLFHLQYTLLLLIHCNTRYLCN